MAVNEPLTDQRAAKRLTLRHIGFFRGLKDEEIRRLDEDCYWRRLEPGATIIECGDRTTDLHFIVTGAARIWLPTTRRVDVILADIGPGEFLGELSALDDLPRSASARALTAVDLATMTASTFRRALSLHADFHDQVLRWLARRNRVLTSRVGELSTLSVRDRVRAELLRLGRVRIDEPNRAVISPPPTQSDVAGRVSTHREAVSRELSILERDGLLERRRGAFVICDVAALSDSLDGAWYQVV